MASFVTELAPVAAGRRGWRTGVVVMIMERSRDGSNWGCGCPFPTYPPPPLL